MIGGTAARVLVGGIGAGTVLRLLAEAPGAMLQTTGRIATDNLVQAGAEIVWAIGAIAGLGFGCRWDGSVGCAYLAASGLLLAARLILVRRSIPASAGRVAIDLAFTSRLLGFGLLVVAAQLADYLYAPTDLILIDRLLGRAAVADYAPGVQVDSALLLIVAAVASVLLPRTALAHARGDPRTSFKYYIRGTLATGVLLALAAGIAIAVVPLGFRLWLGDSMPVTVTLLPLMLINTVIGGSGAVGRSVLLAIGKVRAFTASVLCAGAVNIIAAYLLVKYGHMGLRGIVLGTIIAVVGRCVLWMPWYVWRVSGRARASLTPPTRVPILRPSLTSQFYRWITFRSRNQMAKKSVRKIKPSRRQIAQGSKTCLLFRQRQGRGTRRHEAASGRQRRQPRRHDSGPLPVPPGFTITTETCAEYNDGGQVLPKG